MIPSVEQIEKLSQEYTTIPLCCEIYADIITPITLLRRIQFQSQRFFLLESVEGGESWGRYSFLGFDPKIRIRLKNHQITIEDYAKREVHSKTATDPMAVIRQILNTHRSPRIEGLPPFTGGFVGYFAYAMIGYSEPTLQIKNSDWNDYDLLLFDKIIAYDHLKQKIQLIVNMQTDRLVAAYGEACAEIEKMKKMICDVSPLPKAHPDRHVHFECPVSEADYTQIVEQTKTLIRDGDIFQAVQSRPFSSPYRGSLLSAYRVLRTTNPSPYMVFMSIDGDEIICSSPETLVRLQDGHLTTFPVAGSRPRGKTEAEDLALEKELLSDQKELSEHNMLVDLGRNDIGRIAKINSVMVTKYMMVHRYSKIMHICSQVEGDLREDFDACDAILSILPAGTLSGAPKIRACEIIEALEKTPRGIYGGALGYLDFAGNMDTCIAIRMASKKNNVVTVQAGGGIVADSVPHHEFMESANKAKAVIDAIEHAWEVDQQ